MNIFEQRFRTLPLTYARAREVPIHEFVAELRVAGSLQVLAVGSGGSLVTAGLLTRLIQREYRSLARVMTPLEFGLDPEVARDKHLWLISAEGKNPDILAALELSIAAEPARVTVLCNRIDAPLVQAAATVGAACLTYPTKGERDGFVATHSLLLSSTLLVRAAALLHGTVDPTLSPLEVDGLELGNWLNVAGERLGKVLGQNTLIIAYDPALVEMAKLIETNIWEAALGNVQITDLRNFGHGRHHWFSRHASSTGLLALTSPTTRSIWDAIDAVMPVGVRRAQVQIDSTRPCASLAGLWAGLEITRLAGLRAGVDPGDPGIAEFGRSIFSSTSLTSLAKTPDDLLPALRKQAAMRAVGLPVRPLEEVRECERRFRAALRETRLRGIVLDYDGTIVDTNMRGVPPNSEVAGQLMGLLEAGVAIGVATGRGGSVGDELREVLPREHWPRVLIGYYNGGVRLPLNSTFDKEAVRVDEGLIALASKLSEAAPMAEWIADIKRQRIQLSIAPKEGTSLIALRVAVLEALERLELVGYVVLNSSHSVDVLARGISKLAVADDLRDRLTDPTAMFLCIGDSGAWPGNDFDLLNSRYALSVDRVSSRLDTGWNLLPARRVGSRGLTYYLDHVEVTSNGSIHLNL
jgi:hypothetical protein